MRQKNGLSSMLALTGALIARVESRFKSASAKRVAWFVLLWLLGVGAAVLLALPFRILVALAMGA